MIRQLRVYAFLGLMIAISTAFRAYALDVSKSQVEDLEQKSISKKMEYKKLQAESVQLSLELAKMSRELVEVAKRVQKDEDMVSKTEEELKLLQNKLRVTEENFNQEYQKLGILLASLQSLALHPTDSLLLQPLTPVEIIQSAVLMRESIPFLHEKASALKKDLEDLTEQKKALNKKLLELSNQTEDLKKQQQSVKKLAVEKTKLQQQLEGQTSEAKKEALKLASEASDLRDLMEKAMHEAEIKKRKQEELKRASIKREQEERLKLEEAQLERIRAGKSAGFENQEKEENNTQEKVYYDTIRSQTPETKSNIALSSNGRFTRPVRGDVITSYGQELSKGVTSKGIIIKTRDNAQVVAPYDGTVVFSGPFKGYGNLIIISHNSEIVSLIAGMKEIETENGQMLLAGEPVGIMPDSNAKLYMEIRKNKKPINPLPWLGQ